MLKLIFFAAITQSSVSHDPSETIVIFCPYDNQPWFYYSKSAITTMFFGTFIIIL